MTWLLTRRPTVNLGMQSFTYAEYLSLALAKVWGQKAYLPSTAKLWSLYDDRVQDYGGYGRHFQFLGTKRADGLAFFLAFSHGSNSHIDVDQIRYFVAWLNDAAVKYGGRQVCLHHRTRIRIFTFCASQIDGLPKGSV